MRERGEERERSLDHGRIGGGKGVKGVNAESRDWW